MLARALALAPEAYAADGGGGVALPPGYRLRAVIGDLDSLQNREALEATGVPVHWIAEQDSTDLDKCLCSIAAPLYLGVGFLAGRVDHELAALNALAKAAENPLVLIGRDDVCLRCPDAGLELDLPEGERVSLFPMGPARGTHCDGLRWSVTGLDFAPWGRIGTSNIALGGRVRLRFDGGPMMLILPARHLEAVTRVFRSDL